VALVSWGYGLAEARVAAPDVPVFNDLIALLG
jgi:hypothetical protein